MQRHRKPLIEQRRTCLRWSLNYQWQDTGKADILRLTGPVGRESAGSRIDSIPYKGIGGLRFGFGVHQTSQAFTLQGKVVYCSVNEFKQIETALRDNLPRSGHAFQHR